MPELILCTAWETGWLPYRLSRKEMNYVLRHVCRVTLIISHLTSLPPLQKLSLISCCHEAKATWIPRETPKARMPISKKASNLTVRECAWGPGTHDLHMFIWRTYIYRHLCCQTLLMETWLALQVQLQVQKKKKEEEAAAIHQDRAVASWLESSVGGAWGMASLPSASSIIPLPLAAITHCHSHTYTYTHTRTHTLSKNGCCCSPKPAIRKLLCWYIGWYSQIT